MSAENGGSLNQRIRMDIEANIDSGTWPPGHRIPSEHELMEHYACSRMTVNKVLSSLAEKGVIERRRRVGSFVSRPHPSIESVALEIPDIPLDVANRGYAYRFKLLTKSKRKPQHERAYEAELASDGWVLILDSLHYADDTPFALEERVLSIAAAPTALTTDFSASPPGSWLLQNVPWTRAKHRISAISLNPDQAALLEVAEGAAALVIERQTWRGEQAITYVRQIFLGDSYDLVAQVLANGRRESA